ncbi:MULTISPECIES: hypothetical protein [unclassified Microbacterium]|uniref:hypothetical protein n=1 Tax=unclassified Microbacterium TaxID=2609290 RepID=UPI0030192605
MSVSTTLDGETPLVVIEQLAEASREPWLPPTIDGLVELVRHQLATAAVEPQRRRYEEYVGSLDGSGSSQKREGD